MNFRAIVRGGEAPHYTVPTGDRSIALIGPNGSRLTVKHAAFDAFGTLAADFVLPADASLGDYRISTHDESYSQSGHFAVQAYKKPEYLLRVAPKSKYVLSGQTAHLHVQARYFFGKAAVGMTVHYTASFPIWYWYRRYNSGLRFDGNGLDESASRLADIEGTLKTNAEGNVDIAIPSVHRNDERLVQIAIDARDDSFRTVTTNETLILVPASFFVSIENHQWYSSLGTPLVFTLRATGYDRGPRPGTAIDITVRRREANREQTIVAREHVVTERDGSRAYSWTPDSPGFYTIDARSTDAAGNAVTTSTSAWVGESGYAFPYRFEQLSVIPQREATAPGENAGVLVTSPHGDTDAIVDILAPGYEHTYVVHLDGVVSTLAITPPPDAAKFDVSVVVPSAQGVTVGRATLRVKPDPRRLSVSVTSERSTYQPGDRARFHIEVRDSSGRPARAQVALAVVDDAIFALTGSDSLDPYNHFYTNANVYHTENASWRGLNSPEGTYLAGALRTIGRITSRQNGFSPSSTADAYSVGSASGAAPDFSQLRSDFRDTAYWTPSVVTSDKGSAEVTFTWPDSLTSYSASGIALTTATDIGSGVGHALVTKDFLIRLSSPRFLRTGDESRLTAIAQGPRTATSARLRLSAPSIGPADVSKTVAFNRAASATTHWDVSGRAIGTATLRLAGTSGSLRDGLLTTMPIESAGIAQHIRDAGALPLSNSSAFNLPRGADAGNVRVDISPSYVGQLIADAHLLDVYPYSCVEQTMSSALPAIYVERLLQQTKLKEKSTLDPAPIARRAIERLTKLQHADGSWGWWEHDGANPFMTAYALYGLSELRHDGHEVQQSTIDRGVQSIREQLGQNHSDTLAFYGGTQPNSAWNTRAYMLFALADANPTAVDRTILAEADAHVADLNSYALATLGLAHVSIHDRDGALPLLREIQRRKTDDGHLAFWRGQGWHYRWEDDPIETTAYALRFVHAMTPDDASLQHGIAWLRTQQHGSWFYTTKDTAAAIFAMVEVGTTAPDEFDPHETVRVMIGDRTIKTLRIDSPIVGASESSFTIPATELTSGATLRFEREGRGALYWSTDWTTYARDQRRVADVDDAALRLLDGDTNAPFTVTRRYAHGRDNAWKTGDLVDVDLIVTAQSDRQFVSIEDPFPAGFEYQPAQHEAGRDSWSGLQFFDDRLVFFATSISSHYPMHLHYQLRATTPGTYTAAAPTVTAMYGPPVTAAGHRDRVIVR